MAAERIVYTSAVTGAGVERLKHVIEELLDSLADEPVTAAAETL